MPWPLLLLLLLRRPSGMLLPERRSRISATTVLRLCMRKGRPCLLGWLRLHSLVQELMQRLFPIVLRSCPRPIPGVSAVRIVFHGVSTRVFVRRPSGNDVERRSTRRLYNGSRDVLRQPRHRERLHESAGYDLRAHHDRRLSV